MAKPKTQPKTQPKTKIQPKTQTQHRNQNGNKAADAQSNKIVTKKVAAKERVPATARDDTEIIAPPR